MKWQGRRRSPYFPGRRPSAARFVSGIAGVGLMTLLVTGPFLDLNTTPFWQSTDPVSVTVNSEMQLTSADQRVAVMVAAALTDIEDVWANIFERDLGQTYQPAALVLFKGTTMSACAGPRGAMGPFYCPAERTVFMDTDFFTALENLLGAGDDLAVDYVVAHQVGHHVQNDLRILDQADRIRAEGGEAQFNAIALRIELQADCLAGVWARAAQEQFDMLERGVIAGTINAVVRIGDEMLLPNATGQVQPESFAHGTPDQRQRWFSRGYDSGDIGVCDTFAADQL